MVNGLIGITTYRCDIRTEFYNDNSTLKLQGGPPPASRGNGRISDHSRLRDASEPLALHARYEVPYKCDVYR